MATGIQLNQHHIERLNEVSAPPAGFSSGLTLPAIRQMLFGGNAVIGWADQADKSQLAVQNKNRR